MPYNANIYVCLNFVPSVAVSALKCWTGSTITATCASPSRCSASVCLTFWYVCWPNRKWNFTKKNTYLTNPDIFGCIAAREQLRAVLVGPRATHGLSDVLLGEIPAREPTDAH